jgi:glycosyltransferase involved in cell wall biosynthesis
LFYPAAAYLHKNHKIISQLTQAKGTAANIKEIILTLSSREYEDLFPEKTKTNNLGRISQRECLEYYKKVDALLFPSLAESYGLPLLESMIIGIPIICSDLPYARWLCGDNAIYFNPHNVESISNSIYYLQNKVNNGWYPDWEPSLRKISTSWDCVGKKFISLL